MPWALLINKGKLDSDLVEYLIDIAMSQFENSDETLFSVAISSIVCVLKIEHSVTVISCI